MGLTERHWFENEDVPENYEWDLEDAVYNSCTNKKADTVESDREKVIAWLNEIVNTLGSFTDDSEQEVCQLAKDTLTLLKEQGETELCDRCGRVRLKSNRVKGR